MGTYTDLLFGSGGTAPAPAAVVAAGSPDQAVAAKPKWTDLMLGGGGAAQAAAPPTPVDDYAHEIGPKAGFVLGFSSDQKEALRYMAQTLYPDEPIDTALERFAQTKDGKVIHKADDGKFYYAKPQNWGPRSIATGIAGYAGASIPLSLGTGVGIATAPAAMTGVGLPATAAATAGAAAGGEYLRQKAGDYMMGDASTQDVNPWSVLGEGATSGLGQGIGAGMQHLLTRNALPDVLRFNPAETKSNAALVARHGMKATPGEASDLAGMKATERWVANNPQTASTMRDFELERAQQARGAAGRMLDSIAPKQDAEAVTQGIRDAAKSALNDAYKAGKPTVNAAYDAYRSKSVPLTPELAGWLKTPEGQNAWLQAQTLARRAGDTLPQLNGKSVPTAASWDYMVQAVDDMANKPNARNAYGKPNSLGSATLMMKDRIVKQIDDATGGAYTAARNAAAQRFADLDKTYGDVLGKIAATTDENTLSVAKTAFDASKRTPQMITRLKFALQGRNPDAWQSLKRLYLDDEMNAAMRTNQHGEVANIPGKIYQRFADPAARSNIKAILTPQEFERFSDLMDAYKIVSRGLPANSATEFNRLITEQMRKGSTPLIAKVVRNLNPVKWPDNLANVITERNLDKQSAKLAQIITSGDPDTWAAMRQLRVLKGGSLMNVYLLGHMLSQAGSSAVSAELN